MHDLEECALCNCGTSSHYVTTYIIDNEDQIYHAYVRYGTTGYGEYGDMAFEAVDLETSESLVLLYSKQLGVNCKF